MHATRPSLLVIVPPDWDTVPDGLAELKRYLSDEYGAVLLLRSATAPMRSPLLLHLGLWNPQDMRVAREDVDDLLQRAFYTLDWMEEVL
ncbi:hypothetical protein [Deinococcus navajonensis]|uniref:Uncharacterized protein n=1 Tax=Deinococcus navajonensis TaxID=309884 RepID=A0ABV8XJ01_9DEIO